MTKTNNNNGGGWKIIIRSKGNRNLENRWDIFKNRIEGVRGETTSFFFTDFKEGWRAKDLFFEFKPFGEIDEIVFPTKRDWRGNKYGFVRFVNVANARLLETKLDNIWLEDRKIRANITKFSRKDTTNFTASKILPANKGRDFSKYRAKEESHHQGKKVDASLSYADLLKNDKEPSRICEPSNKEEATHTFFFKSKEKDRARFNKLMIGIIKKPGLAFRV